MKIKISLVCMPEPVRISLRVTFEEPRNKSLHICNAIHRVPSELEAFGKKCIIQTIKRILKKWMVNTAASILMPLPEKDWNPHECLLRVQPYLVLRYTLLLWDPKIFIYTLPHWQRLELPWAERSARSCLPSCGCRPSPSWPSWPAFPRIWGSSRPSCL